MSRSFNGTTDHIVSANTITTSNACTVSAWILFNSTTGTQVAASLDNNTFSTYFNLQMGSVTTARMGYYANTIGNIQVKVDPGTATVSTATWYHTAFSYDITNGMKTYLNGGSDGTAATSGGNIVGATASFGVGYDGGNSTDFFNGRIADVAYWNTNLTAAEIGALAKGARPNAIRPASLIRWNPLDGLASPEPDLSGLANNGTVTGTTLAAGPPIMMLTPRWPQEILPAGVSSSVVFRRSLSPIGTRTGSRQAVQ